MIKNQTIYKDKLTFEFIQNVYNFNLYSTKLKRIVIYLYHIMFLFK